ncbi:hypothetical protein PR202_ga11153 [Eleusine coracana subsp. coracana]|uniref:Uncharacterized protein n=1 Tax=Eleusine coracana subsp. coracana TaxID=191504 RepID=A0AAV5C8U2_ELECO|nr:hypothetical protein PR202_ga11153 [Eleusine coracana subsp. coracana]
MRGLPELWNKWEIQLMVLLSFILQVFLLLIGSIRRRKISGFVRVSIWLSYSRGRLSCSVCPWPPFSLRGEIKIPIIWGHAALPLDTFSPCSSWRPGFHHCLFYRGQQLMA